MCRNNILPFYRSERFVSSHSITEGSTSNAFSDSSWLWSISFFLHHQHNFPIASMQSDLILKLFHKGRKLRHGQFHPCFIMLLLLSRIENNPKLTMMLYMKELRCGVGKPCANKANGTFCFLTPHHPAGMFKNHNQPINRSASSLFRGLSAQPLCENMFLFVRPPTSFLL